MKYKLGIKKLSIFIILISQLSILEILKPLESYSESSNKNLIDYIEKNQKESFYIIGPGDVISLKVKKNTKELNKPFSINGEGFAYLERIGKIYVKGLTLDELVKLLDEKYAPYVREPEVKISILKYKPITIYVDGEVIEPGIHVIPGAYLMSEKVKFNARTDTELNLNKQIETNYYGGILEETSQENFKLSQNYQLNNIFFPTIFDALRIAGGITTKADLTKVKVTRINPISNGGGRIGTNLNLIDLIEFEDTSKNLRLLDGDSIVIAKSELPPTAQLSKALKTNLNPKFINVYVGGRVEKIGSLKIRRNASINEAIAFSGGTKIFKGPIRLLRYNKDGIIDQRKIRFRKNAKAGSKYNPFLKEGDIIYVGKSKLNIASEVISEVISPISGIVTSYGLYKSFTN